MILERLKELQSLIPHRLAYASAGKAGYSNLEPANIYFHSGRTDGGGGHNDNKNASNLGFYHYHHRLPPHLHNGYCPYESLPPFDAENCIDNGMQTNMACIGDPVNTSTGNFLYSNMDIAVEGTFPILFERFYNSIDDYKGILGQNWRHSFDIFLQENSANEISLYYGDGRREVYVKNNDGVYLYKCNRLYKYNRDSYEVSFPDKKVFTFNSKNQIERICYNNENCIVMEYNQDNLLFKLTSLSGYLTLFYDTQKKLERIKNQGGHEIQYHYADNLLTKFINSEGHSSLYSYDRFRRLIQLNNGLGTPIITNSYDINSRVTSQRLANGSMIRFSYGKNNKKTICTEPNGIKKIYCFDDRKRTVEISDFIGKEEYTYDNNDNLTGFIDKNGNLHQYEYDEWGNISKEIDPLGNITEIFYKGVNIIKLKNQNGEESYIYDSMGNMEKRVAFDGSITQYEYNDLGLLIKIITSDLYEISLSYDHKGNIISIEDQIGNLTKFEYDDLNFLTKLISPLEHMTEFLYNSTGRITSITNADGNTFNYEYNKNGDVIKTSDFGGCITKYFYDVMGNVIKTENHVGTQDKFTYDKMNNLISVENPYGNISSYRYDMCNRLTESIDAEGNKTIFAYDANDNIIQAVKPNGSIYLFSYDSLNCLTEVTDPKNNRTTYEYNFSGQLTNIIDPCEYETKYEYNCMGRLTFVTYPEGHVIHYTYNSLGLVETISDTEKGITTLEYNPLGQVTKYIGGEKETFLFEYDPDGRMIKTITPLMAEINLQYDRLDRLISETNELGFTKYYRYNKTNKMSEITDENDNRYYYEYDSLDNLISVTNPKNHVVTCEYDLLNRLINIKQIQSIESAQHLQATSESFSSSTLNSFEYNSLGFLKEVIGADGIKIFYRYDANGNMIEKEFDDNTKIQYEYDTADLLSKTTYPDNTFKIFTYNPLHQLIGLEDLTGKSLFTRDSSGRITSCVYPSGEEVKYFYNGLGQKEKIIYPNDYEVHYIYDKSRRLKEVWDNYGNETRYEHNSLGLVTRCTLPNGVWSEYHYNIAGQLEALNHYNQDNFLWDSFSYKYDKKGNRTKTKRESFDDQSKKLEDLNYMIVYEYDSLGQLINVSKNDRLERNYFYDSMGNRLITEDLINNKTTINRYNALNQLLTTKVNEIPDKYYKYDCRGNMTEITTDNSKEASFVYDYRNMLTQIKTQNHTVNYIYNGFGNRTDVSYETDGQAWEQKFVHDITKPYQNVLYSDDGNNPVSYTYGQRLIHTGIGSHSVFYQYDELGSPIRLSDYLGNTKTVFRYDEFGIPFDNEDSNENGMLNFGFTGYTYEPVGGLYYAQARYYHAEMGRFITMDNYPCDLNRYRYCYNNPLIYVDYDGNVVITTAVIGTMALGAVIGAGIGGGAEAASQKISNPESDLDWGKIIIEAGAGAISGALTGSPIGPLGAAAGNALIGGVKSITKDLYDNKVNDANISGGRILKNAGFDAVTGLAAGAFGGAGAHHPTVSGNNVINVKYNIIEKTFKTPTRETANKALKTGLIRSGGVALATILPPYGAAKERILGREYQSERCPSNRPFYQQVLSNRHILR